MGSHYVDLDSGSTADLEVPHFQMPSTIMSNHSIPSPVWKGGGVTPCKRRRLVSNSVVESDELSDHSRLLNSTNRTDSSCELDSTHLEMRSYLGSFECEEDVEEEERSRLEELMKTPDVKTAHKLLSTLAEFSPSNPFRSPLRASCTPSVLSASKKHLKNLSPLLEDPCEISNDSNLSVRDVPQLISATSTPFITRPEFSAIMNSNNLVCTETVSSSQDQFDHESRMMNRSLHEVMRLEDEENTVQFTPTPLAKTEGAYWAINSEPNWWRHKAMPTSCPNRIVPENSVRMSRLFRPEECSPHGPVGIIRNATLPCPNLSPSPGPRVMKSTPLGKIRFREHSRSPVADGSFSNNRSPTVTVKPFERTFGSPVAHVEQKSLANVNIYTLTNQSRRQTCEQILNSSYGNLNSIVKRSTPKAPKRKKSRRLSPVKPSEELLPLPPSLQSYAEGSGNCIFEEGSVGEGGDMSAREMSRMYSGFCRELFKVKLRHAAKQNHEKQRQRSTSEVS